MYIHKYSHSAYILSRYAYIYICIYVYIYIYIYKYIYLHMCIYLYICMHIYIYIFIYKYNHSAYILSARATVCSRLQKQSLAYMHVPSLYKNQNSQTKNSREQKSQAIAKLPDDWLTRIVLISKKITIRFYHVSKEVYLRELFQRGERAMYSCFKYSKYWYTHIFERECTHMHTQGRQKVCQKRLIMCQKRPIIANVWKED